MHKLLIACVLLGCGARVIDAGPPPTDAALANDTSSPSPGADTAPIPPEATDAGPTDPPPPEEDAVPPEPTMSLAECFGDMGKSNPSTLKDLLYNYATCKGSAGCFWQFRFNVGCNAELTLSGSMMVRTATVNDDDCKVLRNWSTSDRLLNALNMSSAEAKACMASLDTTRAEDTIVGGTPYGMKTYYCPVEPFTTHRRCMQMVIAKYFPPK